MKSFFMFPDIPKDRGPLCVSETYQTPPDNCANPDGPNPEFTLTTEDGGGGPFAILHARRISFGDCKEVDAFARIIKRFIRRIEKASKGET